MQSIPAEEGKLSRNEKNLESCFSCDGSRHMGQ